MTYGTKDVASLAETGLSRRLGNERSAKGDPPTTKAADGERLKKALNLFETPVRVDAFIAIVTPGGKKGSKRAAEYRFLGVAGSSVSVGAPQ